MKEKNKEIKREKEKGLVYSAEEQNGHLVHSGSTSSPHFLQVFGALGLDAAGAGALDGAAAAFSANPQPGHFANSGSISSPHFGHFPAAGAAGAAAGGGGGGGAATGTGFGGGGAATGMDFGGGGGGAAFGAADWTVRDWSQEAHLIQPFSTGSPQAGQTPASAATRAISGVTSTFGFGLGASISSSSLRLALRETNGDAAGGGGGGGSGALTIVGGGGGGMYAACWAA